MGGDVATSGVVIAHARGQGGGRAALPRALGVVFVPFTKFCLKNYPALISVQGLGFHLVA